MSFISLDFILFFPLVVFIYFLLPHRFRWMLLLFASCAFYMAFIPKYILVLLFTIVIDYFAAIQINRAKQPAKKIWLVCSIIANTGVLAVFKYYNFFIGNLQLTGTLPLLKMALPIGLSFHTFQAMAYTIEVYRGKQLPEKHFGIYALYILFFPQLVAGPIERPQNVLPQFYEKKEFTYSNTASGLRLILWGFFKKIVIAGRLAQVVDLVYENPAAYGAPALAVATFFFAFQIYTDFSAYSDIALGTARILGFRLMRNFYFPYQSRSLHEFWTRWHISLSTWFRDYVYIPLGGNRVRFTRWCFNLMLVFVLSGFWHGANWTFIIWGALNGIFILLEKITAVYRLRLASTLRLENSRFYKTLQVLTTFVLINITWIFFRARTMSDAFLILNRLRSLPADLLTAISAHGHKATVPGSSLKSILICVLLIAALVGADYIIRKRPFGNWWLPSARSARWAVYYLLILLIFLYGVYDKKDFIYFQF